MSEWTLDSPIVIDQESQVIRDLSFWQGASDLSCTVYVMYDETNLYLAVDVTEDTPFGAIEMLPLDGEDNFKIYISTDPAADPARTEYGTNDFLLYLIVDNNYWDTAFDRSMIEKDYLERFTSKGMDGGEDVLEGYERAAATTSTGFIFEAVIPWGELLQRPHPGLHPGQRRYHQVRLRHHRYLLPLPGHRVYPADGLDGRSVHQHQPLPVGQPDV